jgi:environmental stress-induced protein Ves
VSVQVLRAAGYRRMRWKNGGGWTSELAAFPGGAHAAAFDWRISIAEVDSDGAFSLFAGCDRHIALLDGIGMELRFDDGAALRLDQRLRFAMFAGEAAVHGRLLSGPVRDFNVIVQREAFAAEVLHRPLVGPMLFLPDARVTWFVHLAGGQASVKDVEGAQLAAGDSLLLPADRGTRNVVLTGGGDVVVVKLTRVAAAAPTSVGDDAKAGNASD